MRAGGCTVQQALTPEAASIIKQAVTLARRRGHAQVTPLHVANTMLSSSTGLLRAACLQSHSHPLQCKALELCFNVALNRLPASTSSGPMLGPHQTHHHPPSLSNALVAAFKRAQAHQRRGSMESQQQPLLAVKIEIEQLIVSILDDPSVSRVMREAGFSSTQVKSNVEQAVSLQICTPTPSAANHPSHQPKEASNGDHLLTPSHASKTRPVDHPVRIEDVGSVLDCLIQRRKRSIVVVGECLATADGVVKGVMDKFDKGEVAEVLREVQFVNLPFYSFGRLSKEEVEQKIGELRCLVNSCGGGRGAVLYLGDLKWAAEFRASSGEKGSYYCPVEHSIMEIGRLICGGTGEEGSTGRIWLMGISTYQTYMRCRVGNPSLETVWGLHPLTIPAGNLRLSLSYDSDLQSQLRSKRSGEASCWPLIRDGLENQLRCCADCSANFEIEVRCLSISSRSHHGPISSTLPSWLQQYKEEKKGSTTINDQDRVQVNDLCRKWNSICHSSPHMHHNLSEKTLNFSSVSPPPPSSSYDQHYSNLHQTHQTWPVPVVVKPPWKEQQFWISGSLNPSPISSTSSDTMETEYRQRFRELNAENLKTLCHALEKKVSWQQEIIPEIASTILQCRSGMTRRKDKSSSSTTKEDTWLFFQGGDVEGKERIARELACLVYGSQTSFTTIGLSSFSESFTDDSRTKRSRSEASQSYLERFSEAICSNPHSVIYMEDIDQVDYDSQMGIKRAIERGRICGSCDEQVCLEDAIIILSCGDSEPRSRAGSPHSKQKLENEEGNAVDGEKETSPSFSLDLNLAVGGGDAMDVQSFDEVGLVELVDRQFFFKLQQEL